MKKPPKDINQLGKFVVDAVTQEKDPSAVALGRKGGKARNAALSKERKSEIARAAVKARWDKHKK